MLGLVVSGVLAIIGLAMVVFVAVRRYFDGRAGDDQTDVGPEPMPPSPRLVSDLYAIRRRLEVARFRFEVRRDAAEVRRRLEAELRELERGS